MIVVFGRIVEDSMIIKLWAYFRWPLAAVLYFLVVLYNYYVLPIERMSLKDIVPGSLFGAAGMVIVTFFYSVYTNYIVNYSLIYGSLSSIVALLFWFYFLAWTLDGEYQEGCSDITVRNIKSAVRIMVAKGNNELNAGRGESRSTDENN